MGPLMRDREKQQWNGVIYYLLGAWIVLSFFPKVPYRAFVVVKT
jgi:diacylglycerol kinase (CTP)